MATKKTDNQVAISIEPLKLQKARITLVGDTPLIVHAWSEKAKKEMLASQQKKKVAKSAMAVRDPFAEFCNAAYWISHEPEEKTPETFEKAIADGAKFGFPVIAVKLAALSACYRAGKIPNQMSMKCSFYLNAVNGATNGNSGVELAVIQTDKPPVFREDMVKIGGINKTSDLRYRPAFVDWKMDLIVTLIDNGTFTMESVINAINLGGAMGGIGEWRMERDGDFGRYHVEIPEVE